MTERAPTGQPALEKERAKLERQRAKLEHQADVLNREEAFGKYDENVTPAEGEVTYEQYLEQRPAEGVIRDGNGFRDAQSGNFASQEQYETQLSEAMAAQIAREHNELKNEGEYEAPQYDEMTLSELAQAVSDAQELGDRAAVEQAREEVQERFTMDIINEGNDEESSETAQERFDMMMNHFEAVAESAVHYNGEKVVVGEEFEGPSGKKVAEIVDADGNKQLVYETELTFKDSVREASAVLVSEPIENSYTISVVEKDSQQEPASGLSHLATELPDLNEPAVPGKVERLSFRDRGDVRVRTDDDNSDVIVATIPEGMQKVEEEGVAVVPEVAPKTGEEEKAEVENQSRRERAMSWLKGKTRDIQKELGIAYWRTHYKVADTYEKHVLNRGVDKDTMSEKEIKEKRDRNRHVFLAGSMAVAGVAVLGISTAVALSIEANESHEALSKTFSQPEITASFEAPEVPAEVPPAPVEAPIPAEVFNIPSGGGGEQLFEAAGIDKTVWYNNENALLSDFPDELYRMTDGHVGIADPGMLSPELQDRIQSLK